jgi:hypothetical protein
MMAAFPAKTGVLNTAKRVDLRRDDACFNDDNAVF